MLRVVAAALLVIAFAMPVQLAHASDRGQLQNNYQSAVIAYESTVDEQERNIEEISAVEDEILETEHWIEETQQQLNETTVTLYKGTRDGLLLVDLLLDSNSFQDAIVRYDQYERIAGYYYDKAVKLSQEKQQLSDRRMRLERLKVELEYKAAEAKRKADEAALALLDNTHSDGASFHQLQGEEANCGATAFIMGVNTLLHENRYIDNVDVWKGPGFEEDSTSDLAWRGSIWLLENGLLDMISIEAIPDDIHTAQEMREWLEQGYVILASSGSGSEWQRVGEAKAADDSFPDGHWIEFYCYDDGVFYANDSAVVAEEGAGCTYNEEQMQQWLDGRENHFACAMSKR